MVHPKAKIVSSSKYRPDIDGLRALAVLSVFAYHLRPSVLPGGFLGVDVFFVISGFLITGIILRENYLSTFSFKHFYARRIKRIFPALFVVLLLSALVGTFLLTPENYDNFMRSSRYAAGQLSNFFFSRKVDYFSQGFAGQPLLHTWSLGVEEQFYLFWPLLIFTCYRLFNRPSEQDGQLISLKVKAFKPSDWPPWALITDQNHAARQVAVKTAVVFLLISVVSFGLCYHLADTNYNLAFYMFYARAFEFCIGGFISMRLLPRPASTAMNGVIGVTGLRLLGYSLYFVQEERLGTSFLQFGVLLPCIGTALVIHARSGMGIANRLLAAKIPAAIGRISYSLYLYHWPVIIFWKLFSGANELSAGAGVAIIGVTFILSTLSYFFVEKPARQSLWPDGRVLFAALGVIVVFALSFKFLQGASLAPWRITEYHNDKSIALKGDDPGCEESSKDGVVYYVCQQGAVDEVPVVALAGDSHAPHYLSSVTSWAKKRGYNVKFLCVPGCPIVVGDVHIKSTISKEHEKQCGVALQLFEHAIIEDPLVEFVLIAQRFDLFYDGIGYLNEPRAAITFRGSDGQAVADHTGYYKARLAATLEEIRGAGKEMILLKQVPIFNDIEYCKWEPRLRKIFSSERPCRYDWSFIDKWQQPSINFVDRFAANHQVETFDPMKYLQKPLSDGVNMYNDSDHMSQAGSLMLVPYFAREMDAIVNRMKKDAAQ